MFTGVGTKRLLPYKHSNDSEASGCRSWESTRSPSCRGRNEEATATFASSKRTWGWQVKRGSCGHRGRFLFRLHLLQPRDVTPTPHVGRWNRGSP